MTPLYKNHFIEKRYITEIINLINAHGDYMVIGKGILLAHASPKAGVKHLGVSFTLFKHPFTITNSSKKVKLIVSLAPIDQTSHLPFLTNLLKFTKSEIFIDNLNTINTNEELVNLLKQGHLVFYKNE